MSIKIREHKFDKVAVLVLDDSLLDNGFSEKDFKLGYSSFKKYLKLKNPPLHGPVNGVTVIANDEVIEKRQDYLRQIGFEFLPNWQENPAYRDLLREGLEQDRIYVMYGIAIDPDFGYAFSKIKKDELEIMDPQGKINIRPRQ